MSTPLPETELEERLRWVLPVVQKQVRLKDAALVFPYGKRTLERWVALYKCEGEKGLTPKSTRPKTNPKETPIRVKEEILTLRKNTKHSALTLKYKAAKLGIRIHERTIGKLIKSEGLTRRYRVRKITYRYMKAPLRIGELVEIDIKYVPERLGNKRYYQFTAIDCASRWRLLSIYDSIDNDCSMQFLRELVAKAPFKIAAVKTDNGSCFTNRYTGSLRTFHFMPRPHGFDLLCEEIGFVHYLIDPGKSAQNGKVERSHRTDQEHFYDEVRCRTVEELRLKLHLWNMYYNNLEHIALCGKTPNEMLGLR